MSSGREHNTRPLIHTRRVNKYTMWISDVSQNTAVLSRQYWNTLRKISLAYYFSIRRFVSPWVYFVDVFSKHTIWMISRIFWENHDLYNGVSKLSNSIESTLRVCF